jgi:uncharacterized protein (TIGR02300 family)
VTKPELGTKRRCASCEAKFFDLNKEPIVCPKCMAVFAPPPPDPVRSRRQPLAAQKPRASDVPVEMADADNEAKPTADAETETEEADLLLIDDQDEKLDPAEIIDGEIEKEDG